VDHEKSQLDQRWESLSYAEDLKISSCCLPNLVLVYKGQITGCAAIDANRWVLLKNRNRKTNFLHLSTGRKTLTTPAQYYSS